MKKLRRVQILVFLILLAACARPAYTLTPNPTPYLREKPSPFYLYLPQDYTSDKEFSCRLYVEDSRGGEERQLCKALIQINLGDMPVIVEQIHPVSGRRISHLHRRLRKPDALQVFALWHRPTEDAQMIPVQ